MGPGLVDPGEELEIGYRVTNQGSTDVRYNFSFALEYSWEASFTSISFNGEDVVYNVTEYGVETRWSLPVDGQLDLRLELTVPRLTRDPVLNLELGLEADTRATVAFFATPLKPQGELEPHLSELTIQENHDVLVECSDLEASMGTVGTMAERTTVFYVNAIHVSNENDTDTIRFSVLAGAEEGWQVTFSRDNFYTMAPFEERELMVFVTSPQGFLVDEDHPYRTVTVTGMSSFSLKGGVLEFNLTLLKKGAVNIYTNGPTHQVATPGTQALFNVTVQNVGNFRDNFSLSSTSLNYPYWVSLNTTRTCTLDPLEATTVLVRVLVSDENPPSEGSLDQLVFTAVSVLSGGTVSDTLDLSFELGKRVNIRILPEQPGYELGGGRNLTIPVLLENSGNCGAGFFLSVKDEVSYLGEPLSLAFREERSYPWKQSVSPEFVSLAPRQSLQVSLKITTPLKGLLGESNNLSIIATYDAAQGQELEFSNSSRVNINITRTRDFKLSVADHSFGGIPGEYLKHTLNLTSACNFPVPVSSFTDKELPDESRAEDEEELLLCRLDLLSSRGWPIRIEFPTSFVLEPFATVLLHFQSMVETGAVNGSGSSDDISAELFFDDGEMNFTRTTGFKLVVEQFFQVSVSVVSTEHKIVPGGLTSFELVVSNEGNGEDVVYLNVTDVPAQFSPLVRNLRFNLDPFSSQNYELAISMDSLSAQTPDWGTRHRLTLEARSQLENSATALAYTPWMTVSFLGVFEAESLPELDIETIYKQNEDVGELNDVVTGLETYIYNSHSIAVPLRIFNLGFGDGARFVIRDMVLPPFMTYRLVDGSYNELRGSDLVLGAGGERKLFLIFSVGDFNRNTFNEGSINPNVIFRMHIESDELPDGHSITNSFIVRFHFLKLDLWLTPLELNKDVVEGRNLQLTTTLSLQEGEIAGLGPIGSGIRKVDSVTDIVIHLYEDDTFLDAQTIPEMTIAGGSRDVVFSWTGTKLVWYEKDRDVTLRVEVVEYQCYQGEVDFNPDNNLREEEYTVKDATIIDITVDQKWGSFVVQCFLQAMIWLWVQPRIDRKIEEVGQEGNVRWLLMAKGSTIVISASLLFTLPITLFLEIFFTVTQDHINIFLTFIFFVPFLRAASFFGITAGKVGKPGDRRIRLVTAFVFCALIIPTFVFMVMVGAVFWLGFSTAFDQYIETISSGSFKVPYLDVDFYLWWLTVFYAIVTAVAARKAYKDMLAKHRVIERLEKEYSEAQREIAVKLKDHRARYQRFAGGEGH